MAQPANTGDQAPNTETSKQGAPEDTPSNGQAGPMDGAKGLAVAATKVPSQVAENVIAPLQNGVTGLGNMFDLGSLLGGQENGSQNDTDDVEPSEA